MVVAGGNSAVISAACHCVVYESSQTAYAAPNILQSVIDINGRALAAGTEANAAEVLRGMATRKLKWGAVLIQAPGDNPGAPGRRNAKHLAFGTADQVVTDVVEGEVYSCP
jgi:hypothetical protein